MIRYRAQTKTNDGNEWVDGNLYTRRSDAELDAAQRTERFGNESRVIEDATVYPWDED